MLKLVAHLMLTLKLVLSLKLLATLDQHRRAGLANFSILHFAFLIIYTRSSRVDSIQTIAEPIGSYPFRSP